MKLKAKSFEVLQSKNTYKLLLEIDTEFRKELLEMQTDPKLGGDISITVEKWRDGRSLDANAYMWLLLDKMAKHNDIKATKEELYRKYIKSVGVFEIVPVKTELVEQYIKRFERNGDGWVCEIKGQSKLNGYTNIATYFGSSTYNTKEMTRLIEEIITDAKELSIDTITPKQKEEMLKAYGERYGI